MKGALQLAVVVALGCRPTDSPPIFPIGGDGGGSEDGGSTSTPLTSGTWSGSEVEGGFGSAVAIADGVLWVGAPFGVDGALWRVDGAGPTLATTGGGRLGAAVAPFGGGALVGAPLAGELRDPNGALVSSGRDGLGLAIAGGSAWVAASAEGWIASNGTSNRTDNRPTSLAWRGAAPDTDSVAVGFARGPVAMASGSLNLVRPANQDEAGFSLAAGDFDGDGTEEWAVGAPGTGTVFLVHETEGSLRITTTIDGDGGRFGHALASGDVDGDGLDDLLIGAPMSGDMVTGSAALYTGGDWSAPAQIWVGDASDDQLGSSVAIEAPFVAIGAPGGAGSTGRVLIAEP